VTVEGEIVALTAFSGRTGVRGIKVLLDDGSGQITLLLWQNVYDAVPDRERLAVGATVRVTGEVDVYQGELQVVPRAGRDVVVQRP
jgi:DNA/RNA endonuclease YhcR with UshA esterase domain